MQQIREMLVASLCAARYGTHPTPAISEAVVIGDRSLTLDQLEFDSLAWMEFCISVEVLSGQELTPAHIDGMRYFCEIEEWLRARL